MDCFERRTFFFIAEFTYYQKSENKLASDRKCRNLEFVTFTKFEFIPFI